MITEATTMIVAIQSDIGAIEENVGLVNEINFNDRADAIDFLEFHVIDPINCLLQKNTDFAAQLSILKQQAENVKCRLERIDTDLFKRLRESIATDTDLHTSFKQLISPYTGYNIGDVDQPDEIGYDNLDIFINGILANDPLPEPTAYRTAEMVFYQQTPVRIIFRLAALAKFKHHDVFFDLGSGLGQVTILINLLSHVTAIGIEYEPAYCNYAKNCAAQLNLQRVQFINTDALKWHYTDGTIFFMYTPFEGCMLQNMLNILQAEANKRSIRIFTYGPCSASVALQSWLACVNGEGTDIYKLYEFVSVAVA